MDGVKNVFSLVFLLLLCKSILCTEAETKATTNTEKDDESLIQSESKDGKLEIIKRIKKVNDDGSYTIGYEADDGSFKIESRDVLGNVKGTYGFLDEEGKIKRVSYSTSNSSEIISKPPETTVVQRIPSKTNNKDTITYSTTRRPTTIYSSTTPTPSSTSSNYVQSIPKRRVASLVSSTQKPNYDEVVNLHSTKSTEKPNAIIYTSAAPRVLLQRPSLATTAASNTHSQTIKSNEGVLLRPEVSTTAPNEIPLFKRLSLQRTETPKPVTEEPEATSNILRRELSPEKLDAYNFQEHIFSLHQPLDNDATDVYNTGVTGTQRPPLFTTTLRPRLVPILSSTTATPIIAIPRPTKYPSNYARQDNDANTPEYTQESGTDNPTSVPVAQIPANREPLVAIRHPYERSAILVPLSQVRGRYVPVETMRDVIESRRSYADQQDIHQLRETNSEPAVVEIERQKVRMLNPTTGVRSLPVQVDEQGYVREMPRRVPTPYPITVPVPVIPAPKHQINEDFDNDIDGIEPPVSVKEFQKLLQHLIMRQKKLEKLNYLMNSHPATEPNPVQQIRYRTVLQPSPTPYVIQRVPIRSPSMPVRFVAAQDVEPQPRMPTRHVVAIPSQQHQEAVIRQHIQRQRYYSNDFEQQQPSMASRRVARLLPATQLQDAEEQSQEEYLPPDIREMLLLKMLQLAINPALPSEENEEEIADSKASTTSTQFKRAPVRNVEILGEEPETQSSRRTKRYKEEDMEYLE